MHSRTSNHHHILVVDDDLPTREALALFLGAEGYRVTTADDGCDALEQLRHGSHPDLILLDLMMPVMDGWHFRNEQLADPWLSDIPVIVCSASGQASRYADSLRASAYLDKPLEPAKLADVVNRSFGRETEEEI